MREEEEGERWLNPWELVERVGEEGGEKENLVEWVFFLHGISS